MKIFGIEFGKKGGDEHEDDHFMAKLGDRRYMIDKSEKSKTSSKDSPDPDDIIKDSLRICYKPYSRYQNFVKQIKNEGWNYVGDVQTYSLNSLSNNIVKEIINIDKEY